MARGCQKRRVDVRCQKCSKRTSRKIEQSKVGGKQLESEFSMKERDREPTMLEGDSGERDEEEWEENKIFVDAILDIWCSERFHGLK